MWMFSIKHCNKAAMLLTTTITMVNGMY